MRATDCGWTVSGVGASASWLQDLGTGFGQLALNTAAYTLPVLIGNELTGQRPTLYTNQAGQIQAAYGAVPSIVNTPNPAVSALQNPPVIQQVSAQKEKSDNTMLILGGLGLALLLVLRK